MLPGSSKNKQSRVRGPFSVTSRLLTIYINYLGVLGVFWRKREQEEIIYSPYPKPPSKLRVTQSSLLFIKYP